MKMRFSVHSARGQVHAHAGILFAGSTLVFLLASIPSALQQREIQASLITESMHQAATETPPDAHVMPWTDEEWNTFEKRKAELIQGALTLRIEENIPELPIKKWTVELHDRASWIVPIKTPTGVRATVSEQSMRTFLKDVIQADIPPATHTYIVSLPGKEGVRAQITGMPKDGWSIPINDAARIVSQSVASGLLSMTLPVQTDKGEIRNITNVDVGDMQLLARGRSDFAGSIPNRIFNLRKALHEHLNGVLIAPGEEFSFNSALDGPVETYNGWRLAMGIFNGDELAPTPGGGICQISTTTYRAALQAGLPIGEQRNHSMYIKYYRKYGEGLDATVYPPSQDLTFTNDTPGYLLILAYDSGTEAIVDIYGTPDGRRVVLEGPYRKRDAPEDILSHEDLPWWGLRENDIAWRQTILKTDGTEEEHLLVSRYKTEIPIHPADQISVTEFDPVAIDGTPHLDVAGAT